jgi:hypothetical protein
MPCFREAGLNDGVLDRSRTWKRSGTPQRGELVPLVTRSHASGRRHARCRHSRDRLVDGGGLAALHAVVAPVVSVSPMSAPNREGPALISGRGEAGGAKVLPRFAKGCQFRTVLVVLNGEDFAVSGETRCRATRPQWLVRAPAGSLPSLASGNHRRGWTAAWVRGRFRSSSASIGRCSRVGKDGRPAHFALRRGAAGFEVQQCR